MIRALALILLIAMSSCSDKRLYSSITVYDWDDETEECINTSVDFPGKIVINTKRSYIKANIFGEEKKFKIESYKYRYNFMSLFHRKKKGNQSL